jgi:murein DD-endopeptidase MepM/ murein hydrolase activator NlpD
MYVGCIAILAMLTVGCSTSSVQQKFSGERLPMDAQDMQQLQADFLEFERYYHTGGDVILENLLEELGVWEVLSDEASADDAEMADVTSEPDYRQEAELVGQLWVPVPEPELIEDPLLHEYCIESAQSWCAPDVEDIYLAYIELEKQREFEMAVFPNFVSPIEDGLVLRGMQAAQKGRRGHYGLDIIPANWEGRGTPIKSVEDGVVVTVSRASGYGYYTVVYHQNGLFSLYSHLLKNRPVKVGQFVERGEPIGQMGKSGNARGYHLHFELIDLREAWNLDQDIDLFVEALCQKEIKKLGFNQFCKLLFAKSTKVDPLPGIPGLAMAKKVNGKWVAVPIEETSQIAQGQ